MQGIFQCMPTSWKQGPHAMWCCWLKLFQRVKSQQSDCSEGSDRALLLIIAIISATDKAGHACLMPKGKPRRTLNEGLVVGAVDDLEGPVLDVLLHGGVRELAPDKALDIVHRVARVEGHLSAGLASLSRLKATGLLHGARCHLCRHSSAHHTAQHA